MIQQLLDICLGKKKRCMHPNIHCSTIYNSQNMEATYWPIDRMIGKENILHIYDEIFSH